MSRMDMLGLALGVAIPLQLIGHIFCAAQAICARGDAAVCDATFQARQRVQDCSARTVTKASLVQPALVDEPTGPESSNHPSGAR